MSRVEIGRRSNSVTPSSSQGTPQPTDLLVKCQNETQIIFILEMKTIMTLTNQHGFDVKRLLSVFLSVAQMSRKRSDICAKKLQINLLMQFFLY